MDLVDNLKQSSINVTFSQDPIIHLRIENLTKIIIVVRSKLTKEQIHEFESRYFKFLVFIEYRKNIYGLIDYVKKEYNELFDIPLPEQGYRLDEHDHNYYRIASF